jgi:hypothetical protein
MAPAMEEGEDLFYPFGWNVPCVRYRDVVQCDPAYKPLAEELLQILIREILASGDPDIFNFLMWCVTNLPYKNHVNICVIS